VDAFGSQISAGNKTIKRISAGSKQFYMELQEMFFWEENWKTELFKLHAQISPVNQIHFCWHVLIRMCGM